MSSNKIDNAIARVDKLIAKGRVHLYKPIQIAELLHRCRTQDDIDLSNLEEYRRESTRWRNEVVVELYGRVPVLNSRYEDQLFDDEVLPPVALCELDKINKENSGSIEKYIYGQIADRFSSVCDIYKELMNVDESGFNAEKFLSHFHLNKHMKRSADKAFEILSYALFNSIAIESGASITLSLESPNPTVVSVFSDLLDCLFGLAEDHLHIKERARFFRVGTANAADAGLDMWANYGPAVQVKHLSLVPEAAGEIASGIRADRVIIVCRSIEKDAAKSVIKQLGLENKVRSIVTEKDLIEWCNRARQPQLLPTVGTMILDMIREEFVLEFPIADGRLDNFMRNRGYLP